MGPSAADLFLLEKKAGTAARQKMERGLRYAIGRTLHKGKTGDALKATSRAVYKDNRLQRITMKAPHYVFKNHYGFEGTKKNGVKMRLLTRGILNIALDQSNVLETLATDIANIRADQAVLKINFERKANAKYITI